MQLELVNRQYKGKFEFEGFLDLFAACKELKKQGFESKYQPETGFYCLIVKLQGLNVQVFKDGKFQVVKGLVDEDLARFELEKFFEVIGGFVK